MARTAQAYAFAAASRSPEGLAALGFLPVSGNEVPMPETDALIMRGMLKVYADDLPGAIADLGVAAARLRTGQPSTYPGPCLAHLSEAHFRRGDWDAAVAHAQLATRTGARHRPAAGPRAGARTFSPGPGLPRPVACRAGARRRGPGRGRTVSAGPGGGLRRDGGRLSCLCARRPSRGTCRDRAGARNQAPRCRGPPRHLQLESHRGGRADRLGTT